MSGGSCCSCYMLSLPRSAWLVKRSVWFTTRFCDEGLVDAQQGPLLLRSELGVVLIAASIPGDGASCDAASIRPDCANMVATGISNACASALSTSADGRYRPRSTWLR